MKRILSIVSSLLGLLALGVLVAILVLTFRGLEGEVEPTFQSSPVAIETETSPSSSLPETLTPSSPPVTPTALATSVSLCTFAGHPATIEPGPSLDAFIFSEPEVVLTHTSAIGIAGWLPDGERLLITRDIPGTNRQSIETFNTRTGEIQVYAQREGANGKPVWLPTLRAVAYITLIERYHELWISHGVSQLTERLVPNVWGPSLAVEPDGKHLWYFSRTNPDCPQRLNVETREAQLVSLDLASLRYPKYPKPIQSMLRPSPFQIAQHPDGSQLVFYTQPWTFLFDKRTNQACEIDLGQSEPENMPIWAIETQWSPNGRYLALITTGSFPGQASGVGAALLHTNLMVLDTKTGDLRTLQIAPDINNGQHYVTDMSWAPDSRHLAVLGVVRITETGSEKEGAFVVDVSSGEFQRVLSGHELGGGLWGWQIAWSLSGSQLAVNCPTPEEGRLCIISVEPKDTREEQP